MEEIQYIDIYVKRKKEAKNRKVKGKIYELWKNVRKTSAHEVILNGALVRENIIFRRGEGNISF